MQQSAFQPWELSGKGFSPFDDGLISQDSFRGYSLFAGLADEDEDDELLESEELDDFSAGFFSDFDSEDLLSPSAEAFMEPPDFDFPA